MYKLLLSWRYLKTRFIALASIVSVTLGVATLIVVNSVMAGFVDEMQQRLHGILSDVELDAGFEQIQYPELHVQEIEDALGDRLEAVSCIVRIPALLNFEFHGRQWTQQVMLYGVDEKTYGDVSEFHPFLMNEQNRDETTFELRESGYDPMLGQAGWEYRRIKFENHRQLQQMQAEYRARQKGIEDGAPAFAGDAAERDEDVTKIVFPQLPNQAPESIGEGVAVENPPAFDADRLTPYDPHADLRPQLKPEEMFNPARDQHTGLILGLAIANRKFVDEATGERKELYMVRPGDDVQLTLPTAGNSNAVTENCTVVDFYNSNMHEYDSSFAFMSLKQLQKLRNMIEPATGAASVNVIQIKVKEGVDLAEVRDLLNARFPPTYVNFVVQTWQDQQRPLLSAVNLEMTILNILLFLIIAVAGFGILATFFMIVVEKTRDIGILKSLGAPSRGVMSIFLGYGISLGAVGTGVGIGLGLLFVFFINDIANGIQWLTGQEIFDPTIYYFSEIPTIVSPLMIFAVAVGAIAIAVLASVLPALRAARLHPVEALRYE